MTSMTFPVYFGFIKSKVRTLYRYLYKINKFLFIKINEFHLFQLKKCKGKRVVYGYFVLKKYNFQNYKFSQHQKVKEICKILICVLSNQIKMCTAAISIIKFMVDTQCSIH